MSTAVNAGAQLRHQVGRLEAAWPAPRWSEARRLEYGRVLGPFTPAVRERAVDAVMRDHKKDMAPPPGMLATECQVQRELLASAARAGAPLGEGVGCPDCRAEGRRHRWFGCLRSDLVVCPKHNIAWRGRLELPAEPEEEPAPEEAIETARAIVAALRNGVAAGRRGNGGWRRP